MNAPIWSPSPERAAASHLARFVNGLRAQKVELLSSHDNAAFQSLYQWSVLEPAAFWSAVSTYTGVIADIDPQNQVLTGGDRMTPPDPVLGPRWFDGTRLNYAENLLRGSGAGMAVESWDETGVRTRMSHDQLRRDVARIATALRRRGVVAGDRVAGWMPNINETLVAMLAASSIGAIWTSCSPDFGVEGIVDRFGQTQPRILFCCDAYRYDGRIHSCLEKLQELLPRLPSVEHVVMVHYHGHANAASAVRVEHWDEWLSESADTTPRFDRLPFDHPLFILYSSGTTGLPKCMVHSAGGTLLQHLKEHQLHVDLQPGERLFYFTTCGWMMWNWQVSALASEASLVLYDGAALPAREPALLWRLAEEAQVNAFGTSAKYLSLAAKQRLEPAKAHSLAGLRCVLSTGSPLSAESFDWVRDHVGGQVQVASISGGTDIISCFVLGNPFSPVNRGEIQGPGLGMAVDVFDQRGMPCAVGEPGELVCTRPFPSMPVRFWNDPDGSRYRAAYFERFPGVWTHGDWIARTPNDGFVISGRSDATLNPGGVRIGTAEIYRQVETIESVLESLVVGQRIDDDERIVLFVRLRPGVELDADLERNIRTRIRTGASPHHVPRVIVAVADLPRTRSGKLSETAVRDVLEGRSVPNVTALANPESLVALERWARDHKALARSADS